MKCAQNIPGKCDIRRIFLWALLLLVFAWTLIKLVLPCLESFLIVDRPLPRVDALVVMAGATSERLSAAAGLFQKGISPKILLTNDGVLGAWSEEKQQNLYHVEWAASDLMQMQVPRMAIVTLAYSSSGSIYDALNARTEILDKGIQSIIIVTSDYHTRRSLWCFERVLRGHSVTIGVYPAKSEVSTLSDFKRTVELSREMLKFIFYHFVYSHIE